jgi:hydrogenase maturation protease
MKPEGARILVAGVGNVFLGDDAFGVEVVRRLALRPPSPAVHVVDFGVRGFDLAYALMEDWEAAILVDVMRRGGAPGTLYVIEPMLPPDTNGPIALDTHAVDPVKVLQMVRALGGELPKLRVVGCEPERFGDEGEADEMSMGMSPPVQAAIEPALERLEVLIVDLLRAPAHPRERELLPRA